MFGTIVEQLQPARGPARNGEKEKEGWSETRGVQTDVVNRAGSPAGGFAMSAT